MSASALVTPRIASDAIESRINRLAVESLPLRQCVGSVLREEVRAERDQPPFDRAAMDGIAVQSAALARDIKRFEIQATQAAGEAALVLGRQDQAIEIMTGAVLPVGCDCVIPVEQLRVAGGVAELAGSVNGSAFHNVHRRGSDAPAGSLLLASGTLLRAPEIAVAASAGFSTLQVTRQPNIMLMSTGNELVDPGTAIADFQVRRSNIYAVSAALLRRGFLRVRDDHAADTEADLQQRLRQHLAENDVLILSGGVSMGKFDLVPNALKALGVEEVFHKIAQRPGKPMWFGIGPRGQPVYGLPGNPVSTLMCLIRYVVPALGAALGSRRAPHKVSLAVPHSLSHSLTQFLPVTIWSDEVGRPWATPKPTNGSGDFVSLTASDGFVELPPGPHTLPQGFVADLYRW